MSAPGKSWIHPNNNSDTNFYYQQYYHCDKRHCCCCFCCRISENSAESDKGVDITTSNDVVYKVSRKCFILVFELTVIRLSDVTKTVGQRRMFVHDVARLPSSVPASSGTARHS